MGADREELTDGLPLEQTAELGQTGQGPTEDEQPNSVTVLSPHPSEGETPAASRTPGKKLQSGFSTQPDSPTSQGLHSTNLAPGVLHSPLLVISDGFTHLHHVIHMRLS